ncbi:MAG: NAD-dependent epimerase/dehydratase family protein [Microcystaceae cyanobacterium]
MKKIFITGASGCIGHYMAESLIQQTNHELYLLVRNPEKLQFNYKSRSGIHILQGSLQEIEQLKDLLFTIDIAILAATSWGGEEESYHINVIKTKELMGYLNPDLCEQVIYFSTASILDRQNKPLTEAGELGTTYIRTKYLCYTQLKELKIFPKITTVFPTLVFGGDNNKPYSHLSGGIKDVVKWMNLIRWFKADGSFHFIHGQDIATVITYLVDHPPAAEDSHDLVLGMRAMTANQTVESICNYLGKNIYFRIPLTLSIANFFIKVFNLKMEDWDRFCISYRHFIYEYHVNPSTFGLPSYCPEVVDIFKVSGIASNSEQYPD